MKKIFPPHSRVNLKKKKVISLYEGKIFYGFRKNMVVMKAKKKEGR